MTNYPAIFAGFIEKGIPEYDIKPRENVFTFNAWKALGRSVKRGEHGVKVVTFIERSVTEHDPATGEQVDRSIRSPHTTTVFHMHLLNDLPHVTFPNPLLIAVCRDLHDLNFWTKSPKKAT
jgi:antirestriction protein ArdC